MLGSNHTGIRWPLIQPDQFDDEVSMMSEFDPLAYLTRIMETFCPIGADEVTGGVNRFGYGLVEDEMHEAATKIATDDGFVVETDSVGNLYFSRYPQGDYYLVASHLDSVSDGGRYDGILGVAAAMTLLKMIKEEGLDIPLKVGAFRCEESTNFLKACLGSALVTGKFDPEDFVRLVSRDGKTLQQVFADRGHSTDLRVIDGVKGYLELHIEQGRVLESEKLPIGVVTSIAGNLRLEVRITGMAEHSGATPMNIRQDALCAAAEIVLAVEEIATSDPNHTSVGTVGSLNVHPNSLNVVPGAVSLTVDLRDGNNDRIELMSAQVQSRIRKICDRRGVDVDLRVVSHAPAVTLDDGVVRGLSEAAHVRGIEHKLMPSGAGHDAMNFADLCPTGMLFVPCENGVSHSPLEKADYADAVRGAHIMLEYLKRLEGQTTTVV